MPERNIELLKELRGRLVAESEKHEQRSWARVKVDFPWPAGITGITVSCATTACAAGTACQIAGDQFLITQNSRIHDDNYAVDDVVDREGRQHRVFDRAKELLGLTHKGALKLFHPDHSRAETIYQLDRLIDGKKLHWLEDDERDWW